RHARSDNLSRGRNHLGIYTAADGHCASERLAPDDQHPGSLFSWSRSFCGHNRREARARAVLRCPYYMLIDLFHPNPSSRSTPLSLVIAAYNATEEPHDGHPEGFQHQRNGLQWLSGFALTPGGFHTFEVLLQALRELPEHLLGDLFDHT